MCSPHLLQDVNVIALAERAGEELGAQTAEDEDKSNEEDDGIEELLPSSPDVSQDLMDLGDDGNYAKWAE